MGKIWLLEFLSNQWELLIKMWNEDKVSNTTYTTPVKENSLYIFKIQVIKHGDGLGQKANITINKYYCLATKRHLIQSETLTLPINDAEYEQCLFILTNDCVNEIEIQLIDKLVIDLRVRHSLVSTEISTLYAMSKLLPTANKSLTIHDNEYQLLQGINDARNFIRQLIENFQSPSHPKLTGKIKIKNKVNRSRIALIGDDYFYHMLDSYYDCTLINNNNLPMIEANLFDIILIQSRAMNIIPDYSSQQEEYAYLSTLGAALQVTKTPVLEIKPSDETSETDSILIPRRNCSIIQNTYINEFEICNFHPLQATEIKRKFNLSLLIPTAADLFRSSQFLSIAENLLNHGIFLTIGEINYKTSIKPILDLFSNATSKLKVLGNLSAEFYAELCRSTPFILIGKESVRTQQDIHNLCATAIMCGSIPIIFGVKLSTKLGNFIPSANCFSELYDFIIQHCYRQTYERTWIGLFRKFKSLQNTGLFHATLDAIINNLKAVPNGSKYPSAELICVSNRPDNLLNVIHSFKRQSYPNLKLHLILNVHNHNDHLIPECEDNHRIRVSIIDPSYNIGSALNYGIRTSDCDYWFKMDDDDYYGKYYVEDMMNWHTSTQVNIIGKYVSFVFLENTKETRLRFSKTGSRTSTEEMKDLWISGNSFSSKKSDDMPYFSNSYRNSCDTQWLITIKDRNKKIVCADMFNLIMYRGKLETHNWKVSDEFFNKARLLFNFENNRWVDAE